MRMKFKIEIGINFNMEISMVTLFFRGGGERDTALYCH